MSINKYKDHVWVIPEDDANRQLALGFMLHLALDGRRIEVQPESGGWPKVLKAFIDEHVEGLRKYNRRRLVLLIDFDDQVADRYRLFRDSFPVDVSDRVYVLGTKGEPEVLRANLGRSLEKIGMALADSCDKGTDELWNDEQLTHNRDELERLIKNVKPFLFSRS